MQPIVLDLKNGFKIQTVYDFDYTLYTNNEENECNMLYNIFKTSNILNYQYYNSEIEIYIKYCSHYNTEDDNIVPIVISKFNTWDEIVLRSI
jgi:hypothetical protein